MGKFVEWSDALSVGIEEIDAQHKVLVLLVNEIHNAIHQRRGREAVRHILNKLSDYTRIHFAVEESLMRILGYPEYEAHREEHAELIGKLSELQAGVATGNAAIGFENMHFLKIWLTKHIMESDQEYAGFFIEAGARPRLKKKSWTSRMWEHLLP